MLPVMDYPRASGFPPAVQGDRMLWRRDCPKRLPGWPNGNLVRRLFAWPSSCAAPTFRRKSIYVGRCVTLARNQCQHLESNHS